jgi:hypothetical protein
MPKNTENNANMATPDEQVRENNTQNCPAMMAFLPMSAPPPILPSSHVT